MWNNIELLTSDDTGSGCLSVGSRKENVTALYQADLLGKISSEKTSLSPKIQAFSLSHGFIIVADQSVILLDSICRSLQLFLIFDTDVDVVGLCQEGKFLFVGERSGNFHLIYVTSKQTLFTKAFVEKALDESQRTYRNLIIEKDGSNEGTYYMLLLTNNGFFYITNLQLSQIEQAIENTDLDSAKKLQGQFKCSFISTENYHSCLSLVASQSGTFASKTSVIIGGTGSCAFSKWEPDSTKKEMSLKNFVGTDIIKGAKSFQLIDNLLFVLDTDNVLSLWDAYTLTPVWNWPSLPVEQFVLTTEADSPSSVTWQGITNLKLVTLTATAKEKMRSLIIYSLPSMETLYSLEVSSVSSLVQTGISTDTIYLLEGIHKNDPNLCEDSVSDLVLRYLTEVLPENRYSVENAFFDEKEDTCTALGEISMNTCVAFLPFMDATFDEVYKLLECPHMNVRKSAYEALGQFCCALHKASQRSSSDPSSSPVLQTSLARVMPAYMQAVKVERERPVVMAVLESLTGVLRTCGSLALQPPGRLSELCNVLKAVLQKKTACQDAEEDDDEDDDQAEYDAMLLEHAGEAIPVLAATAGGHAFAPFFATFLPLLLCKTKQSCTVAEKSFAVGTLAESIQGLGTASAQFVSRLFPVLLNNAREADPEVRSNAIFGLGVLAEHGGCPAQDHFPKLLGLLLPLLARERHDRVRDNICGALARVLMASPVGKTEPQVLATLLRALPLKEDMEEWLTIGHLFSFLHQNNPEQVVDVASELLRICSLILPDNRIPPDTKAALLLLLTFLAKQHTDSFHTALGSLPNDKAQELQAMMGLT